MDFTNNNKDDCEVLINVNGSEDPCYRYKMHEIKHEFISKQGGTTVIDNALTIATEIYRELNDLKSCFSKGLGSKATVIDNKIHIPGKHTLTTLQSILQKYINKNVLCPKCGNPETPIFKKNKRKCQACGFII